MVIQKRGVYWKFGPLFTFERSPRNPLWRGYAKRLSNKPAKGILSHSLSVFFYRSTIGRCRQNPTIVVNTSPYHGNAKESMFMSYCLWNERERELHCSFIDALWPSFKLWNTIMGWFFFTINHTLSQRSIYLSFMVLSQFRIKNIYLLSMYELLIWSEFSDQSILLVKGVEFSVLRYVLENNINFILKLHLTA